LSVIFADRHQTRSFFACGSPGWQQGGGLKSMNSLIGKHIDHASDDQSDSGEGGLVEGLPKQEPTDQLNQGDSRASRESLRLVGNGVAREFNSGKQMSATSAGRITDFIGSNELSNQRALPVVR
jgi:hypothetical protein